MLLFLYLATFCAAAYGQFFGGHPGLQLSPFAGLGGESETLPISQEELAQLMAQSLATSGKYRAPARHQPAKPQKPKEEDEFGSNFDAEDHDDDDEKEGPEAPEAPQPKEYAGNEGGHEDSGEGQQYGQQEGHSEGDSGDSGDSSYGQQPQQYQENSGYENSGPSYQQEGEHYQNDQHPEQQGDAEQQQHHYNGANNEDRHYEPQSHGYQGHPNQQYEQGYGTGSEANENDYRAAAEAGPGYGPPSGFSYLAPGSGYAGPGSESLRYYSVRSAPRSRRFRN